MSRVQEFADKVERRKAFIKRAKELKTDGHSNAAIAQDLGISESSVRTLLEAK